MINQYFLNREVVIFPYDKHWVLMFEEEKKRIFSAIGKYHVVVEHVGSTAIPDMVAKPIIDIMVGTKDLAIADQCIAPLETIGYEYIPEFEDKFPERRYLHRGPNLPNQHYHLHMVEIGSEFWNKQLLFRNYLCKHRDKANEYQQLKETLAKQFQRDPRGYCDAKSAFIQGVLALAKE